MLYLLLFICYIYYYIYAILIIIYIRLYIFLIIITDRDADIFYEAYITPYCRIGPYLIGISLGWLFYKDWVFYKGNKAKQVSTTSQSRVIYFADSGRWRLSVAIDIIIIFVNSGRWHLSAGSSPSWQWASSFTLSTTTLNSTACSAPAGTLYKGQSLKLWTVTPGHSR